MSRVFSVGPVAFQTFASGTPGDRAWTTPANAAASDDTRTVATLSAGQTSQELRLTNPNFVTPIPDRSSIVGMQFSLERSKSGAVGADIQDSSLRVFQNSAPAGDDLLVVVNWPTADAVQNYGGSATKWGLVLRGADVKGTTNGFMLRVQETGAGVSDANGRVDYAEATYWFTCPWILQLARERIGDVEIVTLLWRSDYNGDVDEWIELDGIIDRIVTTPDSGTAPTTLYDIRLDDELGTDVLGTLLAERSATAVEPVWPYRATAAADRHQEVAVRGRLRLRISNAGADKAGVVGLYILRFPSRSAEPEL